MDVDLAELAAANPTISPRRLDTSKAAASAPNSRFCMPLPTKGSMVTDWKCTKSTAGTTSAPAQPTYPKSMQASRLKLHSTLPDYAVTWSNSSLATK